VLGRVLKFVFAAAILGLIALAGFVAIAAVVVATVIAFALSRIFRGAKRPPPVMRASAERVSQAGGNVIDVTATEVPGDSSAPRLQ
jgi:hypothetical protein